MVGRCNDPDPMKRVLLLLLPVLALLASCYKDDVDISTLTTNPLDPDYTGPSFISVTGNDTYAVDTTFNQEVYVTVDASQFPGNGAYQLRVEEINNGDVTLLPQDSGTPHDFTFTNFNVDVGTEYCYRISVEIQFSHTREEGYCATAAL